MHVVHIRFIHSANSVDKDPLDGVISANSTGQCVTEVLPLESE